jgi:NADPH-ferrihemoprotein reductase
MSFDDAARLARGRSVGVLVVAIAAAAVVFPIWFPLFVGVVLVGKVFGRSSDTAAKEVKTMMTTTTTSFSSGSVKSIDSEEKVSSVKTTTGPVTTPKEDKEEATPPPVVLTGSAAMLAKMRKSAAVTGEKRAATAREASTSQRVGKKTDSEKTKASLSRAFVLHGGEAASQIAMDLAESARKDHGVDVNVYAMDDFRNVRFDEEPCVVIFVVETVENAQPAEAAGACVRFFNRKRKEGTNKEMLAGKMSFAVLGLGDTNLLLDRQTTTAKDCNQAAQTLDSALAALGANRIVARGEANDAIGLDEDVVPWSKEMFPALVAANKSLEATKNAKMCFLYGSQTGNAAEICKNLAAEAGEKGYAVEVCAMNEVEPDDVLKPGAVITFVVSSTGDGDAPDNCDTFFTRLKRKAKKEKGTGAEGVQYAVLGLGDQNYSAFMAIPRAFSLTMENLGATCFAKRGECDDTLGLYEQVDAWTSTYWGYLDAARANSSKLRNGEFLDASEAAVPQTVVDAKPEAPSKKIEGVPPLPICRSEVEWLQSSQKSATVKSGPDESGAYTVTAPYMASITKRELLTDPKSDRCVLHMEFDLGTSGISYKAGDSIGVLPQNEARLVSDIVSRLGLDADAVFTLNWKKGDTDEHATHPLPHIHTPCTVAEAFTRHVDVTGCPRKSLLRVLAEHCSKTEEKDALLHLSSRGGRADYEAQIRSQSPTLLTLLKKFPSCAPPLADLLDALSPLAPRLYSITCAPEVAPTTPSVAFSVVKFSAPDGEERRGVATNWLDGISKDSSLVRVPVYVKPSLKFGLPSDTAAPLIMIGPGTGVAPFRGFLQARQAAAAKGTKLSEAMLFFGCRKRDEDFLYERDWNGFLANGVLTNFVCAFSRETSEKVYVQHKIQEHAQDVARLISEGAYIMVCGDGAHMAKDVHASLVRVLTDASILGATDTKSAEAVLADLTKSGRYVRDIWS